MARDVLRAAQLENTVRHNHATKVQAEMVQHDHALQHRKVIPDLWKLFYCRERWQGRARAIGDRTKILAGCAKVLAFLWSFLGCVLARDCVWATLGFFCGLKERFCGEIACGYF